MAAELEQSAEHFRGQARLPGFAAPRRYDLRLTPDLAACTFAGSVSVSVDVAAPTRFLVLNAADLDVSPGDVQFAPKGSGQENWDYIAETFTGHLLTYFISHCLTGNIVDLSQLATDEKGDEAEEFFKSRTKASIARTVKQSIERVRIKAKWVKSTKGEADLGNVLKELAHKH